MNSVVSMAAKMLEEKTMWDKGSTGSSESSDGQLKGSADLHHRKNVENQVLGKEEVGKKE